MFAVVVIVGLLATPLLALAAVGLGSSLLGWLAFLLAAALAALYIIGRVVFRDDRRPDEIHYVKTADGWDIAIWRIKPRGKPQPVPVVLQHGLGVDMRNFDMDDHTSLAHYLAREGYDCWLPALRGCGPSEYRKWGYPDKWAINFDQFVEQDLPAALTKVLETTGAKQVHFVAQSMGAMIGYALSQGEWGARFKSFTAIAGPCCFENMQQFAPALPLRPLLKPLVRLPQRLITTMLAPIAIRWPSWVSGNEVNPENVFPSTLATAAANSLVDLPRDLIFQFGNWVEKGEWGVERAEPWQANMHKITVPIYCLGGTKDFYCPKPANDRVVEMVSSKKKLYREFGRIHGDLADYGHGDLVVGIFAPKEIFPTITAWIRENE